MSVHMAIVMKFRRALKTTNFASEYIGIRHRIVKARSLKQIENNLIKNFDKQELKRG